MIYIQKVSKKTRIKQIEKYILTDAKIFIYNLSQSRFYHSEYFVVGSDTAEELEDLLKYFTPQYIVAEDGEAFEKYKINQHVPKPERIAANINITSVLNMQKKIEEKLKEYEVNVGIKENKYHILIYDAVDMFSFVFNDNLELEESNYRTSSHKTNVPKYDAMKKKIISITAKQRYYYRNKKNG